MKPLCVIVPLIFLAFSSARAIDVTKITIERVQPQMEYKDSVYAARHDTVFIWIGEHYGLIDETVSNKTVRSIVDARSGDHYSIWPEFETYKVYDRAGNWMKAQYPTQAAMDFKAGTAALSPDVRLTVVPTDDQDTIRHTPCRKFEFTWEDEYGSHTTDTWISEIVDSRAQLFYRTYYNLTFFLDGHEFIEEELKDIHGLPMLEVWQGKIRRTSEIISIDTIEVDSTFFTIPADYTEYK